MDNSLFLPARQSVICIYISNDDLHLFNKNVCGVFNSLKQVNSSHYVMRQADPMSNNTLNSLFIIFKIKG